MRQTTQTNLEARIRKAREQAGLTQEEVAEALFVSRQAVSKWESGLSRPSTDNLIRLAQLLGTDVQSLTQDPAPEAQVPPDLPENDPEPVKPNPTRRFLRVALVVFLGLSLVCIPIFFSMPSHDPAEPAPDVSLLPPSPSPAATVQPVLTATAQPVSTQAPVRTFPETLAVQGQECRLFGGYANYGDAVDADVVEDGLLFEYRFPGTQTTVVFYRQQSPLSDQQGQPLYHLLAAYDLGDGQYTIIARIAEDMKMSESNVKVSLHRVRESLRNYLEQEELL